jgi:uncharacterized membrane protein
MEFEAWQFAGPVPPPPLARRIRAHRPRLITLAEDEAVHRRKVERREISYKMISLILAFILAAAVLAAGIAFVATGKSVAGLVLLVAEVAALAGVLLSRKLPIR